MMTKMIIHPSEKVRANETVSVDVAASPDSWPSDRQAQPNPSLLRIYYLLWVLLVVANITDLLASKHAFERGAIELNPIANLLLEAHGIAGLAVFKAFWLAVLLSLVRFIKGWVQWLYVFACAVYFALAVYHLHHL